jgi:hypothetical protein
VQSTNATYTTKGRRDGVWYASGEKIQMCVQHSVMVSCDGAWYSRHNSPSGHSSTRYTKNMPPQFSGAVADQWIDHSVEHLAAEEHDSAVVRTNECSDNATNIDSEQESEPPGLSRHPLVGAAIYCTNRSSSRAHNCTLLGHDLESHGWVSFVLLAALRCPRGWRAGTWRRHAAEVTSSFRHAS